MKTIGRALVATMMLLPCLASAQVAGAAAPTLTGVETRITTNLADQFDPAISGNLIVYTDTRGADRDIWYYDLATGLEAPVTTAPGNQDLTDVSQGLIVYTDESVADVVVFDTIAHSTTNLTNAANSLSIDPSIGQKLVAWTDNRDGNIEIYAKDLITGEERRISNSPDRDERSAVSNGTIAWQRCGASGTCDIFAYDWASKATRQITNTPADDERMPDISGTRIVYQGLRGTERDIFAFDLATGVETRLALPGDQVNANVSGDFVAFEDLSSGTYKIKLWHIPSGAVFDIATAASGAQFLNDIDGNRVVFTDDRNGQLDIYLYEFTAVFPAPPNALPQDCAHLNGARPVLDNIFERTAGAPHEFKVSFAAEPGDGLICITNGPNGSAKVSSGEIELNEAEIVREHDFNAAGGQSHEGDDDHRQIVPVDSLERRAALLASNELDVELSSRPGSAIRIQIFQAPGGGAIDTAKHARHHAHDHDRADDPGAVRDDLGSSQHGLTADPEAVGCSQSGAGLLAPLALAALALLALMPRPSVQRARSRRSR